LKKVSKIYLICRRRMKIRSVCQAAAQLHSCAPQRLLWGGSAPTLRPGHVKKNNTYQNEEFMVLRKLLIAPMVAGSLGSVSLPATSAVIVLQRVPLPLRAERAPPPRRGYVWVPGHWDWRGHRHLWVKGNWVRDRPGYTYRQPRWEERDGRWQMERGNWARTRRDRANRFDSRPNNPNRQ
jgi:hypothetical protein